MSVLLARRRTAVSNSNAITGALIGPTTITTSTSATATAYANQRKVDRCQNGVLWSMFWDGTSTTTTSMDFYYSTDNGATWTKGGEFGFAGTSASYTPNASFFIDLDDYAHVVYKDRSNGFIYYRRGTPNAARTAWTWSAATQITFGLGTAYHSSYDYPDIVAHREGAGWAVHIVGSNNYSTSVDRALYAQLSITSAGVVSVADSANLNSTAHANTNHKYPSIDFNHTGDGKTVAGSTPHLYVAWSAGATSAGKGIRFKKATYSGGTWTWGTEREIDSTRYVGNTSNWLNCLYDGTRVIMTGGLADASANSDLVLHERDAADTATTTRTLGDNVQNSSSDISGGGSATYDGDGNVYLFGRTAEATDRLIYKKWTRAVTTLGSAVVVDASFEGQVPYVSAKRGFSNGRIEFIYTDGTASPYNVVYGGID